MATPNEHTHLIHRLVHRLANPSTGEVILFVFGSIAAVNYALYLFGFL